MVKASFVTSKRSLVMFVLSVVMFSVMVGAAFADETHKFDNGISFSYPSGYQAVAAEQGGIKTVTLMNASDPSATFAVTVSENTSGVATIPEGDLKEDELGKSLPEGTTLLAYKKITVAGKDALLTETLTSASGMEIFAHSVVVVSDKIVVSVAGTATSKDKMDECRKTAEKIENSLKF